jgi:hypothetical protein
MSKSSAFAHDTRTAIHECGCVVEYATDRHGEYPVEVNGCATNDAMFEAYLADPGSESNIDFVTRVKAHRGREIA